MLTSGGGWTTIVRAASAITRAWGELPTVSRCVKQTIPAAMPRKEEIAVTLHVPTMTVAAGCGPTP